MILLYTLDTQRRQFLFCHFQAVVFVLTDAFGKDHVGFLKAETKRQMVQWMFGLVPTDIALDQSPQN